MSVAHARGITLIGLAGFMVDVQVQRSNGLPCISLVGLPDVVIKEAKHRVRAAIAGSGIAIVNGNFTINLAPAALPKNGTGIDLAIALALIAARFDQRLPTDTAFVGELSLDGSVVAVNGVLPMVSAAANAGCRRIIVPKATLREAELIPGIEVIGVGHLLETIRYLGMEVPNLDILLQKMQARPPRLESLQAVSETIDESDMSDVIGQDEAKFALEVAAAGGHNWFMTGLPGSGKTMLAKRLPSVLPKISIEQALEVAAIRSVSGIRVNSLSQEPPFEAPHHGASFSALIGGGSRNLKPGIISRANHGVLFLDEAPEFNQRVLDGLRQVVESGKITIDRIAASTTFPAHFQLVMAANPCPCGTHGMRGQKCSCTPHQIVRYQQRISGPLLDRIDIFTAVTQPSTTQLREGKVGESSAQIRERVANARNAAAERWKELGVGLNARLPAGLLRPNKWTTKAQNKTILPLVEAGKLTLRGADKVVRLAWTLTDLDGRTSPDETDFLVATSLRNRK